MFINLKYKYVALLALFFILNACKPESEPILYGEDKCEFCRMTIVDQKFGGEVVTKKGKIFKFDAVECLVNYVDERVEDESQLEFVLTNTFDKPGELLNASSCTYLISENMPSPMGMFINPFAQSSEAVKFKDQNTGSILNWEELRADFTEDKKN
jgi:copper chaperone NosL